MPSHIYPQFPFAGLKKLSLVLTLMLVLPPSVNAAGLGKLTVLSSLGQPLRAEIELTAVSREEEGMLVASLASEEAFRKANIDFNPFLSSLHFSIEQHAGKQLIRISSSQVVNEPFIDLLLELKGGGRQVREYTFLLDPPEMRQPQTAQVAPAAPVTATPAPVSATAEPAMPVAAAVPAPPAAGRSQLSMADEEPVSQIVSRPAPSRLAENLINTGRSDDSGLSNAPVPAALAEKMLGTARAGKVAASSNPDQSSAADSYRVRKGDTLGHIAARNKDSTVSLDQMLVALYRANPDAFIGANMNLLRAGYVLNLPAAPAAAALDQAQARSIVVAQAQDFNSYRSKLAAQIAGGAASQSSQSRRSGSGKITARVEEKAVGVEARDKLQLSKGGLGEGGKTAVEEKIAADKALTEANQRLKELEQNVNDLQKLLAIKNKTLAELSAQQKNGNLPAAVPAASAPVSPATAADTRPAAAPESPASVARPEAEGLPKPPLAAPTKKLQMPSHQQPEPFSRPGFFDHLEDNPFAIPSAGLLLALLGGLGFVRVRNKRRASAAAMAESESESDQEEALAEVDAMPPVEQAATLAQVNPAEPALPAPVAVDPLEEAERYIAFGRDDQAEDILRLALKSEPKRQEIYQKLLEIYQKRQDISAFNALAQQLHDISAGAGATWEAAAAMGRLLDPAHPLFGGAEPAESLPMPAAAERNESVAAAPEAVMSGASAEPEAQAGAGLEFDLNDFKAAEIATAATPDIGSKIDFDLELDSGDNIEGMPAASAGPAAEAAASAALKLDLPEPLMSSDTGMEDEASAFAAEMTTKLDLAEAYREIGDKEGALELLEEVIRGGNDSQIERARDMLGKLK